ncbi:MAG: tRNA (N6-isopentenyl adenosine(37)-C2)-methylthiotransferase MiaB [Pyrinomonadaceae bacterium]
MYIETYGCQMNVADAERASTLLRAAGYSVTRSLEGADVVLLNSCSVRARAEQRALNRLSQIYYADKRPRVLGIMGCVAQLEGEALFDRSPYLNLVVGTGATDRLPVLITEAGEGAQQVVDRGERADDASQYIARNDRHSPHVAFVPIIEGCNKFCTYCIVPYSRGRERSRPPAEIIGEVTRLISQGYREVHFIGQNVNSYRPKTEAGLERFRGATPFSRLLRAVAATSMPRIKFTTSFPRDFHPDIVSAMDENENLCNWIHLPVQSGSDRVLKAMRRGYSVDGYLRCINNIKNARRKYALTTDIIVGFPGETVEDFDKTLELVLKCQYDSLYAFKYSERRGTPAAKLEDDVDEAEKSERFIALENVQSGIQRRILENYLGQDLPVLVEGVSARSADDLTGHSACNKVVNFPGAENLIGQIVNVRITATKSHSLYGTLV